MPGTVLAAVLDRVGGRPEPMRIALPPAGVGQVRVRVEAWAVLTGGGADHVLERVGRAEAIRQSWEATRPGGRTTVVGMGGRDERVSFSALELFRTARTLAVGLYGDSDPQRDIAPVAEHARRGRLDLAALSGERIGLGDVGAAFDELRAGAGRFVVVP